MTSSNKNNEEYSKVKKIGIEFDKLKVMDEVKFAEVIFSFMRLHDVVVNRFTMNFGNQRP